MRCQSVPSRQGMRDENVVEAQRVWVKCRVTARGVETFAIVIERHLPNGPACGVGHEEMAVPIESDTVGDEILAARA